jgi:phospholipase C
MLIRRISYLPLTICGLFAASVLLLWPAMPATADDSRSTVQFSHDLSTVTPDPAIAQYAVPSKMEPRLSAAKTIALLRQHVKYVFVIYQENRAFDSFFGTFPGADGLFSQPSSKMLGFNQPIMNIDGTMDTIHPFRIEPDIYSEDLGDTGHSHTGIVAKMDIVDNSPKMDNFALVEEKSHNRGGGNPTLAAKQYGELTMAYVDGDTIPFLWRYANRFVLCDHIFQFMAADSTPGNLAIIGAQTGATQWMLHPDEAIAAGGSGPGVPVMNDTNPFWGSGLPGDTSGLPTYGKGRGNAVSQLNLTYATIPLTLSGKALATITPTDRDPKGDLGDVTDDVAAITAGGKDEVGWGWYQEGFVGATPVDEDDSTGPVDAAGRNLSYVTHHNGPQYFGYISNNPQMAAHMHGMLDFFKAVTSGSLSDAGGLYYVKGGSRNSFGLMPVDPDPQVQKSFQGDDDHPNDSDSQIAEAMAAKAINAIANSKYWNQCAIIITWDDSEGQYDHIAPPILAVGPDGVMTSSGPRVPFILISPYAKTHAIDHSVGSQASVVKFADTVFGVTPLADLPDELKARKIGEAKGLKNQGPFDDLTPDVCDLTSAFDPARLAGKAAPLPPSYAIIPDDMVNTLPATTGYGWHEVGVIPTDYAQGIVNTVPSDFSPRPKNPPRARPFGAPAGGGNATTPAPVPAAPASATPAPPAAP